MSLLIFLAACGIGALSCLAMGPSSLIGRLAGIAGLVAAFIAAIFIGPDARLAVGDITLSGSTYGAFFLACAAGSGAFLCVLEPALAWPDDLAPGALAAFAGLGVALTASDPGVALAAGAAAAAAGALAIVPAATRSPQFDGRLAEIRTIGVVAATLLLAALALRRPSWNAETDAPVFALAYFGLAIALAVRSGAVPFHVPAARAGQSAAALAPALLIVWLPAGLGVLVLSWSAATFGVRSDWLAAGGAAVQLVAVATILLGALAALVHDELDEVVVYSIVADAGFVLLAFAARSDATADPVRLWLLAFIAAKTGFVAWAAAVKGAFDTASLRGLRGWLRRTPLLGLALVLVAVATLGWPGSAVFEARSSLIRLALPDGLQLLFTLAFVLSIACYARILVFGLLPPTEDVRAARGELPRWEAATIPDAIIPDPPATGGGSTDAPAGGFRRRVASIWRMNRTVEVSLFVVAGTVLAAAVAFGGLGANRAAGSGIPLDTAAHATAAPTARPTPAPSLTPAASSVSPGSSPTPAG